MEKFKLNINFLFILFLFNHDCVGGSVDAQTCQSTFNEIANEKLFKCERMTMLQVNETLVRIASMVC